VLATGLVFLSRSATGIILYFILNIFALVIFAWVKWKDKLHFIHYLILGLLFSILIILTLSNLDFLFGLLNKNTSLTGRVPLWSYLLGEGLSNHPLLGGGFGFPWSSDQFRLVTQSVIKWGYAPLIADNGYVDIFLHFGLIGIVLLIALILLCFYRSINYLIKEHTLLSAFPLIVMIFVTIANISESLFSEIESFAWLLIILVLFSATPIKQKIQTLKGNK
jgi:exopolysaccharide production protein ExoQ